MNEKPQVANLVNKQTQVSTDEKQEKKNIGVKVILTSPLISQKTADGGMAILKKVKQPGNRKIQQHTSNEYDQEISLLQIKDKRLGPEVGAREHRQSENILTQARIV